ncbi:hypothetical protein SK128_007233 [Halocaridina rubra]|uniref:Uncharacterized protein n=1 Tax=Halocaridina rubra TaxID=373956 RepID=A0AAN9AHJ6_HALRR
MKSIHIMAGYKAIFIMILISAQSHLVWSSDQRHPRGNFLSSEKLQETVQSLLMAERNQSSGEILQDLKDIESEGILRKDIKTKILEKKSEILDQKRQIEEDIQRLAHRKRYLRENEENYWIHFNDFTLKEYIYLYEKTKSKILEYKIQIKEIDDRNRWSFLAKRKEGMGVQAMVLEKQAIALANGKKILKETLSMSQQQYNCSLTVSVISTQGVLKKISERVYSDVAIKCGGITLTYSLLWGCIAVSLFFFIIILLVLISLDTKSPPYDRRK